MPSFIYRIVSGTIGGGVVGGYLGYGSINNNINNIKFNRYPEFRDLPLYGAKLGAVIGGTLYGFYPIVIPYMAYKTGTNYELTREEIQKISQNLDINTLYDIIHNLRKL